MDDHIRAAEQATTLRAIQEALWGGQDRQGQDREGILFVVKSLASSVDKVAKEMQSLVSIRQEMSEIKHELADLKKYDDKLIVLDVQKINKSEIELMVINANKDRADVWKAIDDIRERLKQPPIPAWVFSLVATAISIFAIYHSK